MTGKEKGNPNESLSATALEDFYSNGLPGVSREDAGALYELRLAQLGLEELREGLLVCARYDPPDLPGDVVTQVSSDLQALVQLVEWAVGVASVAYSNRLRRDARLRKKRERGEL